MGDDRDPAAWSQQITGVAEHLGRFPEVQPLSRLTGRERDVFAAMAEGKSNQGIAELLFLSRAAIEKHVTAILNKLGLGASQDGNRRVLAVLAYLRASQP